MSDWFRAMFPDAESAEDLVLLYSFRTRLGIWKVYTPIHTFRIQHMKEQNDLWLFFDREQESDLWYPSVFDAIIAVSQHRTGRPEWDDSSEEVSDYLLDWKRHVSKRVKFNYLDLWLQNNRHGSLSDLAFYFEHDDTAVMDRMRIKSYLKEMIVTGQLDRLPSSELAPSEFSDVVDLAKSYGIPVG